MNGSRLRADPDPHLRHNETIGLVLTQAFFDDLQQNLIVPAILNLESFLNLTFLQPWFLNISLMTLSGNGTSVKARGLAIDNNTRMFQLHDGFLSMQVKDLTADLELGYEFVSDPPILADMGVVNLTMEALDLMFNLTTFYKDYNMSVNVTDAAVKIDNFELAFDGVNDFVYVTGNFINRLLSIVVGKVLFIIEQKIEQVIPLINRVLDMIPNKIPINGTALHIDIGFADDIECVANSHMKLPLSLSLQSDVFPYTEANLAVFPNYTNSTYEIEAAMSQWFIDDLLYELHANGLIVIDSGDLLDSFLTVGWVKSGTGGNWTGFDSDAPCKVIMQSLDPYPQFHIHPKDSDFTSNFSMALHCKRHNLTEEPYEYCITYDTEVDFTANVDVNEKIRLVLQLNKLSIVIKGVIDSARGSVSYWLINLALAAALGTVKLLINGYLKDGFDMNWIVQDILGLSFFYFKELSIEEQEQLFFVRLTPGFNISWINNGTQELGFNRDPHVLDLTGMEKMINDMGGLPKDTTDKGIEKYMNEKLQMVFDL